MNGLFIGLTIGAALSLALGLAIVRCCRPPASRGSSGLRSPLMGSEGSFNQIQ